MAKFSKNNFRLIIEEIEDSESYGENIWIAIGILEIMYDDYAGILDHYFHLEKKDRNIDKLWEDLNDSPLGPETKKALKNLSNKLWKENYQQHNYKTYTIPTGPRDSVYPKITWTDDDNLSNKSTRATFANTIPPERG